jgi:hypothetical protein
MKDDYVYPRADVGPGMELRDWFAGKALAGILAADRFDGAAYDLLTEDAYKIANAMMEARKNAD